MASKRKGPRFGNRGPETSAAQLGLAADAPDADDRVGGGRLSGNTAVRRERHVDPEPLPVLELQVAIRVDRDRMNTLALHLRLHGADELHGVRLVLHVQRPGGPVDLDLEPSGRRLGEDEAAAASAIQGDEAHLAICHPHDVGIHARVCRRADGGEAERAKRSGTKERITHGTLF